MADLRLGKSLLLEFDPTVAYTASRGLLRPRVDVPAAGCPEPIVASPAGSPYWASRLGEGYSVLGLYRPIVLV